MSRSDIITIFSGLGLLILTAFPLHAQDRCQLHRLERFLDKRAFELSAKQKIGLYADELVRYYGKRNISKSLSQ